MEEVWNKEDTTTRGANDLRALTCSNDLHMHQLQPADYKPALTARVITSRNTSPPRTQTVNTRTTPLALGRVTDMTRVN